MSTALTTLSPEKKAFLEQQRSLNQKPFVPRIPELKLANKKMDSVNAGEFYLQEYDSEKKEKVITPIGESPKIVILKKAATYSYYSEDLGRLVAWTSDIEGYSELDPVVLFKNDGSAPFVEFKGNYLEFKAYALKHYTMKNEVTGTLKKLLSFKTVLYVLYEQKVYRMFVSNPGVAGIAEGAKTADFKKPQLLSLTHFLDVASSGDNQACLESVCELGSKYVSDSTIPFYMMQFKKAEESPDMDFVLETAMQLQTDLKNILMDDIRRMSSPEKVAVEAEPIDPKDLPF